MVDVKLQNVFVPPNRGPDISLSSSLFDNSGNDLDDVVNGFLNLLFPEFE